MTRNLLEEVRRQKDMKGIGKRIKKELFPVLSGWNYGISGSSLYFGISGEMVEDDLSGICGKKFPDHYGNPWNPGLQSPCDQRMEGNLHPVRDCRTKILSGMYRHSGRADAHRMRCSFHYQSIFSMAYREI